MEKPGRHDLNHMIEINVINNETSATPLLECSWETNAYPESQPEKTSDKAKVRRVYRKTGLYSSIMTMSWKIKPG